MAINKLPSFLLEPYNTEIDFADPSSSTSPRVHCRTYLDPETLTRTTVWISQSHDRQCQNMTIFDGWRICVQVPNEDWVAGTFTGEDVRRAALLCMGRQYVSEKIAEKPASCFVSVLEGAAAARDEEEEEGDLTFVHRGSPLREPAVVPPPSPTVARSNASSRRSSLFYTPYPSSQLIRPSAPEPYPPAETADHGHETLEVSSSFYLTSSSNNHNQMELDPSLINTPKVISSFFVVSRTDVAVCSQRLTPTPPQSQCAAGNLNGNGATGRIVFVRPKPWWRRVKVPKLPVFTRRRTRRVAGMTCQC